MKTLIKLRAIAVKSLIALFSLAAFAWPSTAQATYVTQGVMAYEKRNEYNIDVKGLYYGNWTQCTYNYYGFSAYTRNLDGCGITANPEFKSGGKYVSMAWTVVNNNTYAIHGKLGAAADSMIADNDAAGIDVMMTGKGKIKGLKMVQDYQYGSSYNAQLNLYFRDTAGVTDCTTYWFGSYYGNQSYGNYVFSQLSNATAEPDGGYYVKSPAGEYLGLRDEDSAICLSWDVDLEPGESKTYSFLLGIGEKSDPPEWYPDAESAAALGLRASARTLTSIGKGTDVTTSGNIMMYVMSTPNKFGAENEKLLGTTAAAGKTTPVTLAGDIDTTGWAKGLYILDYWLVNDKGAMSADTIRKPIQIMEDGTLNVNPGDETTYLVEGACENANNYTNFAIRVFGIGQDPGNTGVATTNDFDAVIDEKGVFYSLLPDGHYDVVVTAWPKDSEKPITVTALVDVEGAATTLMVRLPTSAIDSVINDKATKFNGTVVGGLDQLGEAVKGTDTSITNVIVELDVVDKTEAEPHADELKVAAVAGDPTRQCDFVDLTVWVATNQVTNIVHDTGSQLIQIGLPFPDPKHCFVRVHRWHDDQVEQLPEGYENRTTDGEYFTIDQAEGAVNGEVLLNVKKFSLYCISRGKEYAILRLNQPEHGTVELSLDPAFTTTLPDKYAPLWSETNVYVRCAVDEGWMFQGFDADGLKANDSIVLSQKRDFLYDKGAGEWYWKPAFKFKPLPAYSNATSKVVFETLQDLIDDPWTQDGDVVKLTRDVTVEEPLVFTKSLVLDGDGHTLKVEKPYVKEDGSVDPDASAGGVIKVPAGVNMTVTNVVIEGGAGEYAVENKGALFMYETTVKNSNGGITNATGAALYVRDSRIGRNVAQNGAALCNSQRATFVNTVFADNRALGAGGAVFCALSGASQANFLLVENCVFADNSAVGCGGAIMIEWGKFISMDTTFGGNFTTTANGGGAIYLGTNAVQQNVNTVFVGNFVYDTATSGQTANDIEWHGAFAGMQGKPGYVNCLYGVAVGYGSGTNASGRVTGPLYAGYASGKRLYGADSVTAVLNELPVTALKDADEPLSRYLPLSNDATEYLNKGVVSTVLGVDPQIYTNVVSVSYDKSMTIKWTLQGEGEVLFVDNAAAYAATNAAYVEGTARVALVPGASGTQSPMAQRYLLRIKESPANGSVSGITLYGSAYEAGTPVTLAATPDAGYFFKGWFEEDGTTLVSEDAVCTLTMPANEKVLVATFGGLTPQTGLWVTQGDWVSGEVDPPAHEFGGKVGPGADVFEFAPTNDVSLWAINKPVNPGVYYIKYAVEQSDPYAAGSVTNIFRVGAILTYHSAGGTFADGLTETNLVVTPDQGYVFPTAPTRANYTFAGWFDSILDDAEQALPGKTVNATELYAKWKSSTVTPGASVVEGDDTADGKGLLNAKPTGANTSGDIAIPERAGNDPAGKAIVSIAASAYTPKQYEKKYNAPAITSVAIPMFLTEIGNYAFYGNTNLESVVFAPAFDYLTGNPAQVYIRNQAFAKTAITNVTFPVGGSYKLGYLAFANNAQLKDVWILGDVTIDSLDNAPFRGIGADCGGTTFHLSPSKMADAAFVAALTNGVNLATVKVSDTPAGTVAITNFSVVGDPIEVTFTLTSASPWKTVSTETVSLLYSNDPSKLVVGDCAKIPATVVEKQPDGSYRAKFPRPAGASGFFTICVGD